jgi:PncC family amidohydrolase
MSDLISEKTKPSSIESIVVKILANRRQTLAVAESMSGGNLSARLTSISGSSEVFMGGVIVYSALSKSVLTGLDPALIAACGTVSEVVTSKLATAIRQQLDTDWGVAITGNAGPTADRGSLYPVGTCFIAIANLNGVRCSCFRLCSGRADVQARSVSLALDMLRRSCLTMCMPAISICNSINYL